MEMKWNRAQLLNYFRKYKKLRFRVVEAICGYVISKVLVIAGKRGFQACLQWSSLTWLIWHIPISISCQFQTKKASCHWQTCATLAKSLHGLRKSSGVVSYIASLPIDSLPMVSYYRPIVTFCVKCTVFEIWRHIGLKSPKNLPHPHLVRSFGVTPREFFDDSYLARNKNHGAIRRCTFHDPAFALLGTIPACDGRTDG